MESGQKKGGLFDCWEDGKKGGRGWRASNFFSSASEKEEEEKRRGRVRHASYSKTKNRKKGKRGTCTTLLCIAVVRHPDHPARRKPKKKRKRKGRHCPPITYSGGEYQGEQVLLFLLFVCFVCATGRSGRDRKRGGTLFLLRTRNLAREDNYDAGKKEKKGRGLDSLINHLRYCGLGEGGGKGRRGGEAATLRCHRYLIVTKKCSSKPKGGRGRNPRDHTSCTLTSEPSGGGRISKPRRLSYSRLQGGRSEKKEKGEAADYLSP